MNTQLNNKFRNTVLTGCFIQTLLTIGILLIGLWSNSRGLRILALYNGFGILVWLLTIIHLRQRTLVNEEQTTDQRRDNESTLFDSETTSLLSADRKLRQMEKFFFPIFVCLMGIALIITGIFFLNSLSFYTPYIDKIRINQICAILAMLAFCAFITGRFCSGMADSSDKSYILKAGSGYLLSSALINLIYAGAIVLYKFDYSWAYTGMEYAVPVFCMVLGADLSIRVILDIYRPRVADRIDKPAYQSFLLSLLAEPDGIIKSIAHALDYQFGFKISDTWFYRFMEKTIAPLILFQFFLLYALSTIVIIKPYEQGIIERFGKPDSNHSVFTAGLHFKWPWPIESVRKIPVHRIQSVELNPAEKDHKVILWAKDHHGHGHNEHMILVPNNEYVDDSLRTSQSATTGIPVSLIVPSADIQYVISDPYAYAYNNTDVGKLIEDIGWRELTRYAASTDLIEFLSEKRLPIGNLLKEKIQAEADKRNTGIHVVFVGMYQVHPPHQVAQAFQSVVGSLEEKQSSILSAKIVSTKLIPAANARSAQLIAQSKSYALTKKVSAQAEADRFKTQNTVFTQSPVTYKWRSYLTALTEALTNARKVILSHSLRTDEIDVIDLTEKSDLDLFDINTKETNQ